MAWDPITSVCVVSDKNNVPAGYEIISSTIDNVDADLWKDKLFRKQVYRYLCFTRERNQQTGDLVLADITILKEGDKIQPGYTCIGSTRDSNEQCLKKKSLVVRLIRRSETNQAITDIYLTSGKTKHKPVETTARSWDVNGLSLYLRFGPVIQYQPINSIPAASALPYQFPQRSAPQNTRIHVRSVVPVQAQNGTGYPIHQRYPLVARPIIEKNGPIKHSAHIPPQSYMHPSNALPHQAHPVPGPAAAHPTVPVPVPRNSELHRQTTLKTPGSPEHQLHINAIDGVPFQLNPVLTMMNRPEDMLVPSVPFLSADDLISKYDYDFTTEHTVKRQASLS